MNSPNRYSRWLGPALLIDPPFVARSPLFRIQLEASERRLLLFLGFSLVFLPSSPTGRMLSLACPIARPKQPFQITGLRVQKVKNVTTDISIRKFDTRILC